MNFNLIENKRKVVLKDFFQNIYVYMYLTDLRIQIRNFLIHNSKIIMNTKVLIGCFPILFGISKAFYGKYQDQSFSNLFQHTLPGMCSKSAQLSWPTFEQIFVYKFESDFTQSFLLPKHNSCIKSVDFYTDSVLIKPDLHWNTKQKQLYGGFFFNSRHKNTTINRVGNNWYTISLPSQAISSSHYNLSSENLTKSKKNWIVDFNFDKTKTSLTVQPVFLSMNTDTKTNFHFNLDELPTKLHHNYVANIEQNFSQIKYNLKDSYAESYTPDTESPIFSAKIKKRFDQSSKKTIFVSKKIYKIPKLFSVPNLNTLSLNQSSLNPNSNIFLKGVKNLFLQNEINQQYIGKTSFLMSKPVLVESSEKFDAQAQLVNLDSENPDLKLHEVNPYLIEPKGSIKSWTKSLNLENKLSNQPDSLNLDRKDSFLNLRNKKKLFFENTLKQNLYQKDIIFLTNFSYVNFFDEICKNKSFISSTSANFQSILQFLNDQNSNNPSLKALTLKYLSTIVTEPNFDYATVSEIIHFIQDFSCINGNTIIKPRVMSGYLLPDMSTSKNASLLAQFFYKENQRLFLKQVNSLINSESIHNVTSKIWNPILHTKISQNLFHSATLMSTKFNPLQFEVASEPVEYFSVDLKRMIYKGPSIAQNTNELNISNVDEIKKWVKQFLNSDNPLSDRRETFFGKNVFAFDSSTIEKPQPRTNAITKKYLQPNKVWIDDIKVGVLNKGRSVTLFQMSLTPARLKIQTNGRPKPVKYKEMLKPSHIISSYKYPYITYLNNSEWEIFIQNVLPEDIKKKDTIDENLLKNLKLIPTIYVEFPKQNSICWPVVQFDCTNETSLRLLNSDSRHLILQNQTELNKSKKFKTLIHYHYLPYLQNLTKQILPQKYVFGKTYKKNTTIYKNSILSGKKYTSNKIANGGSRFTKIFSDIVEPISWDSWLFVTQFSIGLFLIYLLQNISKKYGKELQDIFASLYNNESSKEFDGDETSEQENFRIMKNVEKRFRDIAGIDTILPELSEIVWFFRNAGRSFPIGNTIPRRILLAGPPGTGKTLLVQAIAGESEVPVFIESGSSLSQPGTSETSSERLQKIFQQAQEVAPCIIFIDEIDTFGQARDQMVDNPIQDNEVLNAIYPNTTTKNYNTFQIKNSDFIPQPKFVHTQKNNELSQSFDTQTNNSSTEMFDRVSKKVTQNQMNKYRVTQQKANLLMQFLVELDGIATAKKIVVFVATNRPQTLDAALTRPGRFNKTFYLGLPTKQKRIEILKLYSKNLGVEKTISWNYLANLTPGLSAADLASVMNQSAMKAIEAETIHTIQTIEAGIETITGYTTQKNRIKTFIQSDTKKTWRSTADNSKFKDKVQDLIEPKGSIKQGFTSGSFKSGFSESKSSKLLFVNRLAYYQAGKALVHTLLKHHPSVISIHLWPQLKNQRYHLINNILNKEFSQFHNKIELESRIIGFYGGKAGELLALSNVFENRNVTTFSKKYRNKKSSDTFSYFWQSDLGIQDVSFACWVAQLMIRKWYLYSKKIVLEKYTQLPSNSNDKQIKDEGIQELFQELSYETETQYQTTFVHENSQNWITRSLLQREIIKKLEFSHSHPNKWYKIYGGDHEENQNTRYAFPDKYYHNNVYLPSLLNYSFAKTKFISEKPFPISSLTWNDILYWNCDYIYHSLILACFNKAICILDENREILDFFANYLLQKEIIRENEIKNFISNFQKK